jgi:hypothetical protein
LNPAQLAGVISRRPECQLPPEPDTLTALAARLSSPHLVGAALLGLNRPELQLAEALAALGDGCERETLAVALGRADDDPDLSLVLGRLADHAIAWPEGSRIRTVPLGHIWAHPVGLGSPVSALLGQQSLEDLRRTARELGMAVGKHKDAIAADLGAWLAVGDNVRRLVGTAPQATRNLLNKLAWEGPHLGGHAYLYASGLPEAARWAVQRGLLATPTNWGPPQMPREVAVALRGKDYVLPFETSPPISATAQVNVEAVEREGAAAAGAAATRIAALLEACAKTPIAPLKTGGVGVRELRRLGKSISDSEDNVRLWLELTVGAGLIAMSDAGLLPTDAYDQWRERAPAEQMSAILDGWQLLESAPLYLPADGTAKPPAFGYDDDSPLVPTLRSAVLAAAGAVPAGAAMASTEPLESLARWLRPVAADAVEDLPSLIAAVWRETELLGVIAHNAPTSLGRALITADPVEVEAAMWRLLPAAQDTVLLQADLTAVTTGPPSGALAARLDSAADRESRGGAWIWRFSAGSIRRAFDAGTSETELLSALRVVASGGRLPQPLEYLIGDVARQHGRVRVRPVACCLHSDDAALLSEILHAKGLAKLGLTLLAPTVLASSAPVADTLSALRTAGYAPAGENTDGTTAVERMPRQRATAPAATPGHGTPGRITPGSFMLDDLPDGFLAELVDGAGQFPAEILESLFAEHSGGQSMTISDPEELAIKLLK